MCDNAQINFNTKAASTLLCLYKKLFEKLIVFLLFSADALVLYF